MPNSLSDLGFEPEKKNSLSDLGFEKESIPAIKPTMTESGLRGAAQGASFGLADEAVGILNAGRDFFGDAKLKELPERYRTHRDKYRADDEFARETNPSSYTAGELGGSVVTAAIPVAGAAGLWGKVAQGAASGALQGFGTSTADLTKKGTGGNALEDIGAGAAYGGIGAGAFDRLGALAKRITPENVAKKLSNVFLNTPEEITETYIKNPQGVLNAPKRHELAGEYEGLLDKLKAETQQGSQQSRKILADEGVRFKGSEISDILDNRAGEIEKRVEGVWDDPQQLAAYKWLKQSADQYRAKEVPIGPTFDRDLSAGRIKDTLQGIDRSTKMETAPGQFSDIDAIIKSDARKEIDELLKGRSPAYREQMKDVAADTSLLDEASKVAKSPQGLSNVFRRVETDQYGGGQVPRDVLERFGKRMDSDILEKIKLANAKEAFDKSVTNGSRNVNFFSNALKEVPVLKHLAPVLGGTVDKYGRKMTMSAVDTAVNLEKVLQREGPQRFAQEMAPLVEAVKKGNPSAILAFQLLSQNNPDALKHLNQGEPK